MILFRCSEIFIFANVHLGQLMILIAYAHKSLLQTPMLMYPEGKEVLGSSGILSMRSQGSGNNVLMPRLV